MSSFSTFEFSLLGAKHSKCLLMLLSVIGEAEKLLFLLHYKSTKGTALFYLNIETLVRRHVSQWDHEHHWFNNCFKLSRKLISTSTNYHYIPDLSSFFTFCRSLWEYHPNITKVLIHFSKIWEESQVLSLEKVSKFKGQILWNHIELFTFLPTFIWPNRRALWVIIVWYKGCGGSHWYIKSILPFYWK